MNLLASIMFLCAISCCSSQDEEMCTIEDDCDPAQSSNINFLGPPTGTTVYSPPDPILLACEASGELDTVLWIRENSDGESKVLSSTLITAIIPNVLIRADLRDFPPVDKFPYTYQCLAYGKCCEEHKSPSATVNILSVTPTAAVTPTTDIDECLGENSCHDNATCTNVVGSYNCSCNDGFQGDGTNCEDIDECADGSHTCHDNAICTDTVGSFTCECNAGFSGNGSSCEEINECQQPGGCPENAICTDQLGRCEYTCKSGFEGSSCSDLIVDHQEDIPLNFWTVSIVNDITNVEIRKSFVTENELCFDGVIAINCARDVIDGWKINLTSSQHLSLLNASDATIFHSETNSFFILESVQWNHRCLTGEVIQISFAGCTPQNDTLPQITVEFDRNENLCPKISPPADRKSIEVPAILIHNNNSTFRASLNITLPVTVQGNWAIYLAISTQLFQLSAPGVSFSPKQGDIFTLTNLRWREMFMANETHTLEISGYKAAKGFTTPCIAAAFVWENDMEEHHSTVPPA